MSKEVIIQDDNSRDLVEYQFSNVLNPEGANKVAETIKHYTDKNGLLSDIKGKAYAQVEAWQYAGLLLGLFPIVVETKDLSNDNEKKFECTVEIRNAEGQLKGRGVAVCSNAERTKRHFEEYAVLSMAQTRATGKAFRLLLGWMFKLAGYEATTAEEMDDENPKVKDQGPSVSALLSEYKAFVMEAVKCCVNATDVRDLGKLAPTFMKHQPDAQVIDLFRQQFQFLSEISGDEKE